MPFPLDAKPIVLLLIWLGLFVTLPSAVLPTLRAEESEDSHFDEAVLPLLQSKCLSCHSHQADQMEGGLALDSRSGWELGGDSGPAIIPGKPDDSLLIQAVRYQSEELQMPPDEPLSESEVGVLVDWIKRGAHDPRVTAPLPKSNDDWWSLRKLKQPRVPGHQHPIDAFIQRKLDEQHLPRAPRANRTTIARRLYVDLHGLQPTPDEVARFVKDDSADATNRLIDELLASPKYGERWARHWLDVVHFADSHGCEHDVKRPNAWRYRDYVIARLNEDVLWSDFIKEQLAPDVFFPEHPEHMAGLGFVAAGPLELSRAGTAPIAFDYLDRDDIVTQTMASFVSTTANCARCHTHKFDPITQEDYYALQAVFAGIGKGDIEFEKDLPTLQRRHELNELLTASATKDASILLNEKYVNIVGAWESAVLSTSVQWTALQPEVYLSAGNATLELSDQGGIFASGNVPDEDKYTVTANVDLKQLTAVRLEVLRDDRLPMKGPGRAGNGNLHLSDVQMTWFPSDQGKPIPLRIAHATADFDQEGWTASQAIDDDPKSGWAIYPRVNESHHIVFELDRPLDVSHGGWLAMEFIHAYPPKHIMGHFRLSATSAENGAARAIPSTVSQALQRPVSQRSQGEKTAIAAIALEDYANRQLANLPDQEVVYGVSSSWSHAKKLDTAQAPKKVHLLRRGAFDKPLREVNAGTISAVSWLPARFEIEDSAPESARRAALARWLAHPENPLTWRSIVNRVWHFHFGRGLSDTPNDFGRMGSQPTHPELLDWLAVWFRDEAKGSLKELHRLILTSETWQQSSLVPTAENDANNQFVGRMNRFRMDAETLRDSILRISGRLNDQMGGPGVEQFTKIKGPQATPELNYDQFDWNSPAGTRRSIYRVVWRGIPDPFMETFDFPDLGILAPKREFSVSALQALAAFNDDFVLQASRWQSERLQREHETMESQIERAVELVWLRTPSSVERIAFQQYTEEHGLAAFCRLLFNSNEFLFVD